MEEPLITFDGNGEDGTLYCLCVRHAPISRTANRAVITHNVSETIKRILSRDPECELLYDMPHILVSQGGTRREERLGYIAMAPAVPMVRHACRIIRDSVKPASPPSSRHPCRPRHISAGQDGNLFQLLFLQSRSRKVSQQEQQT